jgi:hypothetical protein
LLYQFPLARSYKGVGMRSRHLQSSLWVVVLLMLLGIGMLLTLLGIGLLLTLLGIGLLLGCVATRSVAILGYCVKLLGCRC